MPLEWNDLMKACKENLSIKILAVVLATISIYSIQRITNQTEEHEVAIAIEVEPGVAVLRQDARTAYITCRGSLDDLRRLDPRQLGLTVRPEAGGMTGTVQVPVGPRNVHGVPRTITVTKVRPNLLNLTFDREVEKQVSVTRPELVGKPALGKAEVDFAPRIVTVRGPQQQLADLKIIEAEPIDVENATVSFTRELKFLISEEAGIWEVSPASITARVNIVTEAISRDWPDVPIMILRNPETDLVFTPEPSTVNVSVRGSRQAVEAIQPEDIRVFIDCTRIHEPASYELPATAHLERGADVSSAVTPPLITVNAVRMPSLPTESAPASAPEETDTKTETVNGATEHPPLNDHPEPGTE